MTYLSKPGWGRVLLGICITSFLTGPTLFWVAIVLQLPLPITPDENASDCRSHPTGVFECDIDLIALTLIVSVLGALIAGPASLANALVLNRLSARSIDSHMTALCIGAALGLCIGLCTLLVLDADFEALAIWLAFPVTGVLMGSLHWLIAIKPRRRYRLTMQGGDGAN